MKKYIYANTYDIGDESEETQIAIALDPNTRPARLTELVESGKYFAPMIYALHNPNLPKELIQKYAGSTKYRERAAIALNPSTPLSILRKLSKDTVDRVRVAVAKNPKTPKTLKADIINTLEMTTVYWFRFSTDDPLYDSDIADMMEQIINGAKETVQYIEVVEPEDDEYDVEYIITCNVILDDSVAQTAGELIEEHLQDQGFENIEWEYQDIG